MRTQLLFWLALAAAGCNAESPATDDREPSPPPALATAFDRAHTGRVAGRVTWTGPIPDPPPFLYCVPRPGGAGLTYSSAENPNRPRVDSKSRGVAGAVVFLRGVDAARSRAWDHPPVSVEIARGEIAVVQGGRRGRAGFVRRGESFSTTSAEPLFHILRGRGDAYFSLTLPEPGRPVPRALSTPGRVELSSGTGLYWARADLFVADHPYFTVTDADGQFHLDQVPTGRADVVVWVPGWESARQERNPDTTAITSMSYTPPTERRHPVAVEVGRLAKVNFALP